MTTLIWSQFSDVAARTGGESASNVGAHNFRMHHRQKFRASAAYCTEPQHTVSAIRVEHVAILRMVDMVSALFEKVKSSTCRFSSWAVYDMNDRECISARIFILIDAAHILRKK